MLKRPQQPMSRDAPAFPALCQAGPFTAPRLDYKTSALPSGRYEISIAAKGPDQTRDSLFFQLDGGAMALIDSFPPAGSARLVGFYDLAAGSHTISIYARECGLILQSLKVREI